jgi:hypothetical protein
MHTVADGLREAYAELRGEGADSNPILTTAECRIMVYKLLQCDPKKVWAKINRSGRRTSSGGGSDDTGQQWKNT